MQNRSYSFIAIVALELYRADPVNLSSSERATGVVQTIDVLLATELLAIDDDELGGVCEVVDDGALEFAGGGSLEEVTDGGLSPLGERWETLAGESAARDTGSGGGLSPKEEKTGEKSGDEFSEHGGRRKAVRDSGDDSVGGGVGAIDRRVYAPGDS